MLKRLHSILPPTVLNDSEATAAKILPAILMRVNFIPGVRQRLGWRGVKEANEGFSTKIAAKEGVYGLSFAGSEKHQQEGTATFDLHYFPSPDEELLEDYSVAACIVAQQDDYIGRVREFNNHQLLKSLFHIAQLTVCYNAASTTLSISLRAAERLVLISADGVSVTRDNREEQVVAPGETDQDLAAFDIAIDFFRVLAASYSFSLGVPPSQLQRSQREAKQYLYFQSNRMEQHPLTNAREKQLLLVWGADRARCKETTNQFEHDLIWQEPEEKPSDYIDEAWWQDQVPGARFSIDKNTMGISERPKLIILTGFLGSGKTSFLNHFVEYQAERNAFVAIVQNEIGAKNLDTHLLGQHYAVTEMDEGCICCTLAGNLKLALSEIVSGFQPDFVVVETTGLANPANFLTEISELDDQLDFCSITTVVDAVQGLSTLEKYGVAREQVLLSDVILLNKADEIPAAALASLQQELSTLNPLATVHQGNHGDFPAPLLYGVNLTGNLHLSDSLKRAEATHHHTHAKHDISSILIELDQPLDREQFLTETSNFPNQILRIKGVLRFSDDEQSYYYQYVPGSHSLTPTDKETPAEFFLVVIGEDLENTAQPLRSLQIH